MDSDDSEDLQVLFDGFIQSSKKKLDIIELQYSKEDCDEGKIKLCDEKLAAYEDFTSGLIEAGFTYLEIINEMNVELSKSDATSTTSGSTVVSPRRRHNDAQAKKEIEQLQRFCIQRKCNEELALESLKEIDRYMCQLHAEKEELNARVKQMENDLRVEKEKNALSKPISPKPSLQTLDNTDAEIHGHVVSNLLEALQQENFELKQIIERNEKTVQMVSTKPTEVVPQNLMPNECDQRQKMFEQTLVDKDRTIQQLMIELNRMENSVKLENDKIKSNESLQKTQREIDDLNKHGSNMKNLLTSTNSQIKRICSGVSQTSISELERNENKQVEMFKEGYAAINSILKEKYIQLRKQKDQIAYLCVELDECRKANECDILKRSIDELKKENDQLNDELNRLTEYTEPLEELKQQAELWKNELKILKEHERVLARKVVVQDEHIQTLMNERQYLMKMNNNMLESICRCRQELSKYNVELSTTE